MTYDGISDSDTTDARDAIIEELKAQVAAQGSQLQKLSGTLAKQVDQPQEEVDTPLEDTFLAAKKQGRATDLAIAEAVRVRVEESVRREGRKRENSDLTAQIDRRVSEEVERRLAAGA